MGAIATGGVRVLNAEVLHPLGIAGDAIEEVARRELLELERRDRAYRGDRPSPDLRNRVVILVDDGLATGSTMRAAVHAARQQGPAQVIVAVPVGAATVCLALRTIADDVVCAAMPAGFQAVGLWYDDFSETSDDEVRELLARASGPSWPGDVPEHPDI